MPNFSHPDQQATHPAKATQPTAQACVLFPLRTAKRLPSNDLNWLCGFVLPPAHPPSDVRPLDCSWCLPLDGEGTMYVSLRRTSPPRLLLGFLARRSSLSEPRRHAKPQPHVVATQGPARPIRGRVAQLVLSKQARPAGCRSTVSSPPNVLLPSCQPPAAVVSDPPHFTAGAPSQSNSLPIQAERPGVVGR